MSDEFDLQMAANRAIYDANADTIKQKYAGQYVGIAFGRIVAVDPDYFKVCAAIDRLNPPPLHQAVFMADTDPAMDALFENLSVEFCENANHKLDG
jgi:hypothetical protein